MIHVVARSLDTAAQFTRRHATFGNDVRFELGESSYFQLLNRLIESAEFPYLCLVHDDVTLAVDFIARIDSLLGRLNRDWPNWGLAGNAGILSFKFGFGPTDVLRYLADPHRGPNLQGHLLPVQSIDGNVMLLNIAALRQKNVRLPEWNGFQLYDIALCIEATRAGLSILVAPELAGWHDSPGSQTAFDRAASSNAFRDYVGRAVINRFFPTLNGEVRASLQAIDQPCAGRVDMDLENLRNAAAPRTPRCVAICVRTQFTRPLLLRRALDTIRAFIAAAGEATQFATFVLTDKPDLAPSFVSDFASLLCMSEVEGDSRNRLIRHAAQSIDASWFWFVDDDDWLFPNEAERLGLVLNVVPLSSAIMLDTQHFYECPSERNAAIGPGYQNKEQRTFLAKDFARSLAGLNYIPMCGMIVGRQILLDIPDLVYERVVYYEDFTVLLYALLTPGVVPVVVDRLYAGISLRDEGNSVTEVDRTRWHMSMSNMIASLTCDAPPGALLTMSFPQLPPLVEAKIPVKIVEPLAYLSGSERLMILLFRSARTVSRAAITPWRWPKGLVSFGRAIADEGLRGALQSIAYNGRQ